MSQENLEALVDAIRAGKRPRLLRDIAVEELIERGKTLVRANGKLYRLECTEVTAQ